MEAPTVVSTSRSRSAPYWLYAFLFAAVLLATIRLHHGASSSGIQPAATRKPAELGRLHLLDNTTWTIPGHRGEVILINYWATWCAPCQEELPALLHTAQQFSPQGLAMLGISLDLGPDADTRVRNYVAQNHIPYPIASAAGQWTAGTDLMALPTTLLIDRQGRVAAAFEGPLQPSQLDRSIKLLLAEPAPRLP